MKTYKIFLRIFVIVILTIGFFVHTTSAAGPFTGGSCGGNCGTNTGWCAIQFGSNCVSWAAGSPTCMYSGTHTENVSGSCQTVPNGDNNCSDLCTSSVCGNGTCESGESAASCAQDCRYACSGNACVTSASGAYGLVGCNGQCVSNPIIQCGNTVCDGTETCDTCPGDCGVCTTGGSGGANLSITATPVSRSVAQNVSYTFTVAVEPGPGFNGDVIVSSSGGPVAGGTFVCTSLWRGHSNFGTATNPRYWLERGYDKLDCTYTGSSGGTSGIYTITFTATDTSGSTSNTNVALTVTAPATLTPCITNVCTNTASPGYAYYVEQNQMISTYCEPAYNNCATPDYGIGGTSYWFRQGGKDTAVCLNLQNPAPVCNPAPPTPTGLSVTASVIPSACGQNWLNISWNSSTGASTYQVYRNGDTVPVYNGNGLAFSDIGLDLGTSYSYTVAAKNSAGVQSPLSGSVSNTVAPPCVDPPAPTFTSVSCDATGTLLSAAWQLPTGYSDSLVRIGTGGAPGTWFPPSVPVNTNLVSTTTWNFASTPGATYWVWVHTTSPNGTPLGLYSTTIAKQLVACPSPVPGPTVALETPASGATVSGTILVKGYAIPSNSTSIQKVELLTASTPTLVASSNIADARYVANFYPIDRTSVLPNISSIFGPGGTTPRTAYPNVGFNYPSLNTTSLSNGPHDIIIKAYDTVGNITTLTTPITVNNLLAPTVTLTASIATPAPMTPTLTWVVGNNATSCTASGGWTGAKSFSNGSNSLAVSAISTPTTYVITCSNAVGSAVASVTVTPTGTATKILTVTTTYGGSVVDDLGHISCGTTCSYGYPSCQDVVLTPTPASPQFKFVAWTGPSASTAGCPSVGVGATHTCSVSMCNASSVKAIYTLVPATFKEF